MAPTKGLVSSHIRRGCFCMLCILRFGVGSCLGMSSWRTYWDSRVKDEEVDNISRRKDILRRVEKVEKVESWLGGRRMWSEYR